MAGGVLVRGVRGAADARGEDRLGQAPDSPLRGLAYAEATVRETIRDVSLEAYRALASPDVR